MTVYALDASALMAVIRREPGAAFVEARIAGALICSVNASEAIMRSVEKGFSEDLVEALIVGQRLKLVAFDTTPAESTARLRPLTRQR